MQLIELRDAYRTQLESLYQKEEIDDLCKRSIFYLFEWEPIKIGLEPQYQLTPAEQIAANKVLQRLKSGEPFQYIIQQVNFCGLDLIVSSAVLIPRPETSELVEWILENESRQPKTVFDFCTGSGCIALALKSASPNWKLKAFDISTNAIEIAEKNAEKNKLDILFEVKDILAWKKSKEKIDIIVSNPPYVLPSEKEKMHKNVLDFEPDIALFIPENDPLLFYRKLFEIGTQSLKDKGKIYVEINPLYCSALVSLGNSFGFTEFKIKKDIFGKERLLQFILD